MKPNKVRRADFFLAQESVFRIYKNRKFIAGRSGDENFISKLHIFRNEAWEPYLEHAANISSTLDIKFESTFSPYDDALSSILDTPGQSNFVIWLNWSRVQFQAIEYLFEQIEIARKAHLSSQWYLVLPSHFASAVRDEVSKQAMQHGWRHTQIIDFPESEPDGGSMKFGYTRKELDFIAFKLGTFVAMISSNTSIRAVVVDMDNTLYSGVVGEDQLNEIEITDRHLLLQQYISDLSDSGVLIFIATKNNQAEVDLAFEANLMPNLPKSKLTSILSGWESKANSMKRVIELLNFSERNILFIDDNGRELAELASKYPNILTVGALDTEMLLMGLREAFAFQLDSSGTSETRIKDIQAKAKRSEILQSTVVGSSLLVDLKTRINSLNVIHTGDLDRSNDLFGKTNQFNFSLKRSKISLEDLSAQFGVVNTVLCDLISDSGIISSLSWEYQSGTLKILEFVISCRALGRGTEKYILKSALSAIRPQDSVNSVIADFIEGPRNVPAQEFLATYFHKKGETWALDWDKLKEETSDIGNEIIE